MSIPYGRQHIDDRDIRAVVDVLRSDWLTQGPAVARFEDAVAGYCGAEYGVAFNSATSALHVACAALGLGPGDLLWTSPNTFVASANCARYCGADVDFVDIDPNTLNMSVPALGEKLRAAAQGGRLPKIVVPVHFAGLSCDMAAIAELSREYGFAVIEDASHAIGGSYQNKLIGDCRYSDMTVFSFHPVKIITTCEGGLVTTSRADLAGKLRLLRSHGITRDPSRMTDAHVGSWYYEQQTLGFNYRMSDVHAALGLVQLERIHQFLDKRRQIADRYDRMLASLPVQRAPRSADADSAWHLYVIRVQAEQRGAIFQALREQGIGVNVHYIPVHLQPYYRELGFRPGDFPNAEAYYSQAISLPVYYDLSARQQDQVVVALQNALPLWAVLA